MEEDNSWVKTVTDLELALLRYVTTTPENQTLIVKSISTSCVVILEELSTRTSPQRE